jgi:hypothetical protein
MKSRFKGKNIPSIQSRDAGRKRRLSVSGSWLLTFCCFCLVKTVATINWPTLTWLKRHFSFCTALGTSCRVHLPRGIAIPLALFSRLSTSRTALRFISETFGRIELLFPSSEREIGAAIGTLECFILETQWRPPLLYYCWLEYRLPIVRRSFSLGLYKPERKPTFSYCITLYTKACSNAILINFAIQFLCFIGMMIIAAHKRHILLTKHEIDILVRLYYEAAEKILKP